MIAKYLAKIINHPLHFRIEKDFKIKESTGYLKQIYDKFESPSDLELGR